LRWPTLRIHLAGELRGMSLAALVCLIFDHTCLLDI
jgi:hypothetical protein